MIAWSIVPDNAAIIALLGLTLSLIGVVIGFGGFALSLQQLAAIKSETEAAAEAISSVQLKVASFDTAQECAKSRKIINTIKTQIRTSEWQQVIEGYEALIECFLRLSHSNSNILEDDREVLSKHTKVMATFCEAIRKKLANTAGGAIVVKGHDMALRDFSDTMTKITFAVMREMQR